MSKRQPENFVAQSHLALFGGVLPRLRGGGVSRARSVRSGDIADAVESLL